MQQNVKAALSLLDSAQEELARFKILSGSDGVRRDEGLPLTEILEELDEEGNIVCKYTVGTSS